MMVQWVTRDAGKPSVRWGNASGQLMHTALGDSSTYTAADLCGAPANTSGWMDPGWLHGAVMEGLQPGTRYWYQYGDEVCGLLQFQCCVGHMAVWTWECLLNACAPVFGSAANWPAPTSLTDTHFHADSPL
jgi:hypothetical protein